MNGPGWNEKKNIFFTPESSLMIQKEKILKLLAKLISFAK